MATVAVALGIVIVLPEEVVKELVLSFGAEENVLTPAIVCAPEVLT